MSRIKSNNIKTQNASYQQGQESNSLKREQLYRMIDKFYHTLSEGVSDDSFTIASQIFYQLSPYIDKREYDSLGEAWRNLYTDTTETSMQNLKKTVDAVKIRFA